MSASDHLNEQQFDYRGQHQTIFDGDVTAAGAHEMDQVYPDYYQHPEYYHSHLNPHHPGYGPAETQAAVEHNRAHQQTRQALAAVRGRPDAQIDMYRAVPHGVTRINRGDWVTPSEQYARIHGQQANPENDWPVLRAKARAKDLRTNGDYAPEFGYAGPSLDAEVK